MLNKVVTASAAIQWINASAISIIVLGQVCRDIDADRVILGGRTVKTWAPSLLTTLKRLYIVLKSGIMVIRRFMVGKRL